MQIYPGYQHVNVCPSIARYNFHAYSGGGRLQIALAMLENRLGQKLEIDDKLLEVVFNCQMCGACDVSCKYSMDIDVLEPLSEMRSGCVESGHTLPALDQAINGLRKNSSMVPGARKVRGNWAERLEVKDITRRKAKVLYHAGCRIVYDEEMWSIARNTIVLLQKAGIDIGILGTGEQCCGGRAYQMGYREDFRQQARRNRELLEQSGAEVLVTSCADCYHAFKVLYDRFGFKGDIEVLHATEYFDRLIKAGKLKPTRKQAIAITYHDPCHLGRLGEPYLHWQGKEIPGHIRIFDPPKEFARGTWGVYQPPRNILGVIPGLKLYEMDRTREYAWCCGAGGGVREANPEFAGWTATERIKEAESTGAEALVTACPGCQRSFSDAIKKSGSPLKLYDIADLLNMSI
jgi:Fe-S oxidoreductase